MASALATSSGFKKSLIRWEELEIELSSQIKQVLRRNGFRKMTPVQSASIPLMLQHKDVAVEAVTGSGKTLSFVIPIIEMLLKYGPIRRHQVLALVISPTRELANQIAEVFRLFLGDLPSVSLACYTGGKDNAITVNHFNTEGANVIVGTPGHLRELLVLPVSHLARGVKSVEFLILDEADRLLDMGFKECLNEILSFLPKQRRTGLFSATQTRQLEDLVRAGLRNPVFVKVQERQTLNSTVPKELTNYYTIVAPEKKLSHLVSFLKTHKDQKMMVFFATCASVDYMFAVLPKLAVECTFLALHGKMKTKRQNVFDRFTSMDSGILLCTDVMARGVDFPQVHWVLQYDPPSITSVFVHRCGRTARIGNFGQALLYLLPSEESFVDFLTLNQSIVLETIDNELLSSDAIKDVTPSIKELALKDRAIYEKGNKAFVSYIQSYSKYECGLIFQIKELKVGELAEGMGLLRLPKMPELRGKDITGFTPSDADLSQVKYKDKGREKQRKELWKQKKEKLKEKRMADKLKSYKKKRLTKTAKGKKHNTMSVEDFEELAEGARLLKKYKTGKISKEDFESKLEDL